MSLTGLGREVERGGEERELLWESMTHKAWWCGMNGSSFGTFQSVPICGGSVERLVHNSRGGAQGILLYKIKIAFSKV